MPKQFKDNLQSAINKAYKWFHDYLSKWSIAHSNQPCEYSIVMLDFNMI